MAATHTLRFTDDHAHHAGIAVMAIRIAMQRHMAAVALRLGVPLVTSDSIFQSTPGLLVEWTTRS